MKKVLFLTNYPSPYRVAFFDELAKHMDVTVLFSDRAEKKKHRDAAWFISGEGRFHKVQLKSALGEKAKRELCLDVLPWLKQNWDAIVVCGYSSPTAILAMGYLRLHKIPFYMEVDGGLIREDGGIKYRFKRALVSSATWWLGSGRCTTEYLTHYGAKEENVLVYPFTSLWEKDVLKQVLTPEEKQQRRRALAMAEEKIVLYVGRFTEEKGMDAILRAAVEIDADAGIYFIGGEPTKEHLAFCQEKNLNNVHFVGFQKKDELSRYYLAADLLVLPTHSDVWGLVINEAMACGLAVVTTDRCVAGMELIENGVNGYIVPVKQHAPLVEAVNSVLRGNYAAMGAAALETIRPYTLENMAKVHADIFDARR